jgi:hypothetical protein
MIQQQTPPVAMHQTNAKNDPHRRRTTVRAV